MPGKRVVLVDGDAGWRGYVSGLFVRAGYVVTAEAEDGISGLQVVRARVPDVVIAEVNLAGMSGFELARIVQEDQLAPVILMSQSYSQEVLERVRDAGACGFLTKPFDEPALLAAVEVALGIFQRFVRLETRVRQLQDKLETRKIVEKAKGILMEKMGITEAEAFRRIRKASMNKRVSMRAVAEAIIFTHTL